jgi:HSP20 family protein
MTLVKFNNQHPIQKGFSSFVDEFFQEFPTAWGRDWQGNLGFPPANIHETADALHVEISAPGRSKEDFKINVDNGSLTIESEQKKENSSDDYKTVRREFSARGFKRSFKLDDSIDTGAIQGKYENGVLKLHLPKKEQAKPSAKQIVID